MFPKRIFCLFPLIYAFIACQALNAAVINVGPPPASIQTAINSASNGDVVQLSAGTYVQEVQVINKSIDIIGAGMDVTIIQSPNALTHLAQNFAFNGVNYWCVLMVDNQASPTPQTVNISNLTVDGSNQQDTVIPPTYGNSERFFAVAYHNANGTVSNVHTTNTRQTASFSQLTGGGIVNASNTATTTFNVTGCLVDFYQRIGIDCRGATLTANISNTTVDRGYVLPLNTSTATPNGIQYSLTTTGSIINSTVSTNISTVAGASASGILIFTGGPNVLVSGNTVSNNDLGVVSISSDSPFTASNNTLNYTTTPGVNAIEGMVVQDTNGTSAISGNIFNDIPDVNLEVVASTDQPFQLANNQFFGSQVGLRITGAGNAGPIVSMNEDSFTGSVVYYIEEVSAPNDVWPTTATVSFDGLVSGSMTFEQFNQVLSKIFDKHNDPALGLVLAFIPPPIPEPPTNVKGLVYKDIFLTQTAKLIKINWDPSPSEDVTFYRIYRNSVLIAEIPASTPLEFVTYFRGGSYEITAINIFENESTPVIVPLTH